MRTNSRPSARAIDFPSEVFPTPGGPTKQRIGPFILSLELPHGEILKDPFLHFLKIVVVLVEHFGGCLEVEVVLGPLGPGQFHDPLDIGPDSRGLGSIRVHFLKTFELLFGFLQHLLRHLQFCDSFAKFGDFFRAFVEFAQLF